jgi:hypothetical protein
MVALLMELKRPIRLPSNVMALSENHVITAYAINSKFDKGWTGRYMQLTNRIKMKLREE